MFTILTLLIQTVHGKKIQVAPTLYPTYVKISVGDWLQSPFSILTPAYVFVTVFLTRRLEHRARMWIKERSVEKDRDRDWHRLCTGGDSK